MYSVIFFIIIKLNNFFLGLQILLQDKYNKARLSHISKPVTQESSLDVFCHVIFGVNIDVMDVRGRPQEFVAL
jgi:hypothetical protein